MVIYDAKFADVKPIESKPFTVNAAQMAQINENVFNYFGTNAGILQNKYMVSPPMMGGGMVPVYDKEIWLQEDGQWWIFRE